MNFLVDKKIGGVLLLVLWFLWTGAAYAAKTSEELKKIIDQKNAEIGKLEEEARKYRSEASSKAEQGKTLKSELARIDKTISQLRKDITLNEKKLKNTELEIKKTGLEITEKNQTIKKLRRGLASALQALQESSPQNPLTVLLKEDSLSEFLNYVDYTELLQNKLVENVSDLKEARADLEVKKTEAEEKKETLENLSENLEANKKIKEGVQRERKNLLAVTKSQEEIYQRLAAETEKRQDELDRELEELEEKLRLLINPEALPKPRERFFLWPVEGGEIISQGYGETPFTKSKKGRNFYKFHNGIDIAAPLGTPIKAAEDGVVLGTGDTDKYCPKSLQGKYTVIDHQNNLATMYAHQSLIVVSRGQEVKRGDIIGYVGSTGRSTGPHLHFTVYDRDTLEIKKGPTGACGLVPIGGSIDPMKYL